MRSILNALLPVVAGLVILSSCGEPTLPAITESPTNTYRTGEFVWRDLISVNAGESAKFYSDVFGWEIAMDENASPAYYTIKNRGELIGGILEFPNKSKVDGNEWLTTMSARDIPGAAAQIVAQGGQILADAQTVAGRGEYLVAVDPSGGIVALLNSESGDPARAKASVNGWLWTELWSTDPGSVTSFYGSFGFTFEEESDDGNPYWIFKAGDTEVAGMLQSPVDNTRSMWLPYIKVEDVDLMAERVKRMGGRVISEPNSDVRDGTLALCIDPFGGFFALQEWTK